MARDAKKFWRFGPLMAAALLCGCGSLPAERNIRIDAPTVAPNVTLSDFTMGLQHFEARGVLQERNLAYIDAGAPTEVKQADTITWEEPPETAAGTYLAEALRRAGANVLSPGTPGLPAYALSGTIERFELVDGGGVGVATVALDIAVTETKSAKPYLAASYCAKASARDQKLQSVELAFDAALAEVAAHLVADLDARRKGGGAPVFAPRGNRLTPC